VRDFLSTHELDEGNIVLSDTGLGELLDRESVGTIVEEVTGYQRLCWLNTGQVTYSSIHSWYKATLKDSKSTDFVSQNRRENEAE
jgi:hypothetical protein